MHCCRRAPKNRLFPSILCKIPVLYLQLLQMVRFTRCCFFYTRYYCREKLSACQYRFELLREYRQCRLGRCRCVAVANATRYLRALASAKSERTIVIYMSVLDCNFPANLVSRQIDAAARRRSKPDTDVKENCKCIFYSNLILYCELRNFWICKHVNTGKCSETVYISGLDLICLSPSNQF